MANEIAYLVNAKGDKTSIIVPIETWEKMNAKYEKLQNKLNTLTGIKKGLEEVRDAKKNGIVLQTLQDFLSESNR